MAENRQYDHEYKVQAVKFAKEIGQAKAAKELEVPKNTMYSRIRANRLGNLALFLQDPSCQQTEGLSILQTKTVRGSISHWQMP